MEAYCATRNASPYPSNASSNICEIPRYIVSQKPLQSFLRVDVDLEVGDGVLGGASERLSTLLEDDEVLRRGRVALVLGEVVEEELDVGVEVELPRSIGGDEAEDLHVAVGADEQVPAVTGNVDGRDLCANGPDAADAGEP
jgi:hypothetical protein